eukprot:CAMPEP_0180824322 /NCGR_PEP_ID=MMETSP1038_2-20121128/72379_1 /TAXON_ID=632150 /ORGANISM="Azadinium spinosum, Strain 3D9" /LENGTH=35 /DNA_ID= /DNA_START= /DNA_END= /DNA_ORIENTATION=
MALKPSRSPPSTTNRALGKYAPAWARVSPKVSRRA